MLFNNWNVDAGRASIRPWSGGKAQKKIISLAQELSWFGGIYYSPFIPLITQSRFSPGGKVCSTANTLMTAKTQVLERTCRQRSQLPLYDLLRDLCTTPHSGCRLITHSFVLSPTLASVSTETFIVNSIHGKRQDAPSVSCMKETAFKVWPPRSQIFNYVLYASELNPHGVLLTAARMCLLHCFRKGRHLDGRLCSLFFYRLTH